MIHTACPACAGSRFAPFADFGAVPASGRFYADAGAAPALRRLAFEYCAHCGYVRQRGGAGHTADYSEVDRRTRHQLPDYAAGILGALRGWADADDLVVEVGANDGSFLDLVRTAGCRRRLGIEPSRALAAQCAAQGHAVENLHLTLDSARDIVARHGAARVVLCRHTLEHVPDPLALLRAIRALLQPGGQAFIEVPDTGPIVERLYAHELWDEHLSYFSPGNLRALASRAGLRPLAGCALTHRTSCNLLLWTGAGDEERAGTAADPGLVARCAAFDGRWRRYAEAMRMGARGWRAPVVALGASHPQSNYLLFTGLGTHVDLLVDDDERKRDRHVALPRMTPVRTTDRVLSQIPTGGTVLLSAFGYDGWNNAVAGALTPRGFGRVDPLAPLAEY